jgi:hypothetical protein
VGVGSGEGTGEGAGSSPKIMTCLDILAGHDVMLLAARTPVVKDKTIITERYVIRYFFMIWPPKRI